MDREALAALVAALGGPAGASATVVGQREGTGGSDALAGKSQQELALLDRFSHGAMARDKMGLAAALLGLPLAAGYEGAKAVAQNPLTRLTPAGVGAEALLRVAGGPLNEKTSPASLENVAAYFGGMTADPEELRAPAPPMYAGQKQRP
jgi:hypothetical protein